MSEQPQEGGTDNGRNPTKKRGRPKKRIRIRDYMTGMLGSRNQADMIAGCARLDPRVQEELLPLAGKNYDRKAETTATVLAYLARFPPEQQREMFPILNRLGSRGAKRYVECLTHPPTAEQIGERVARWMVREFPSLSFDEAIAGCKEALTYLQAMKCASRVGKGE
jgi:hypothetical protein